MDSAKDRLRAKLAARIGVAPRLYTTTELRQMLRVRPPDGGGLRVPPDIRAAAERRRRLNGPWGKEK